MKLSVLAATAVLAIASAKDIPHHAFLYERDDAILGKRAVPEATPTGPFCKPGSTQTPTPITPAQLAAAVAGCQGVSATGQTYNDIVNGICKPYTLIFARGTTETGNIGSIVGPPFVLALRNAVGANNLAVQGVNNYPAVAADYCAGGSLTGSQNLASLVQQTLKQCPKTKLTISGYSQGAQVVHNAAEILESDAAATKFIKSVVTFGDPFQKLPVGNVPASKVDIFCHAGDNICANGEEVLPPHLSYCHNAPAAAAFVKAKSKA